MIRLRKHTVCSIDTKRGSHISLSFKFYSPETTVSGGKMHKLPNTWHTQKLMEMSWETGGTGAVVDDNHVRFTAMCFNVLKERAEGDEWVVGGDCGFAFSHAQMATLSTYCCVVCHSFSFPS